MGGRNSKKPRSSNQEQNGHNSQQRQIENAEDAYEKEDTFTAPTPPLVTSPKTHVTSSAPTHVTSSVSETRPPLRFDQKNTVVERKAPSGFAPSSNNQLNSRQFGSNISSVNRSAENLQFNKSQNFYNQPRDKSGKFNSHSGNGMETTPSHYSGVYNRYHDPDKTTVDKNVASLLKKDKFSLLGSQLHEQESQILSRSTRQQSSAPNSLSLSAPHSFSSHSLPLRFDPNKFRKVNETVNSSISLGGGIRNGSVKRAGLGAGPLDDRDEELIASIEREFEFSY